MDVDFSNSRNATILRYLQNPYDFIMGPKAGIFREARERDLAAGRVRDSQSPENLNWLNLGTHPDLVERLWREITVSLPEACQWVVYGSPALVHPETGIVFGWAGGTHTYGLRIPEPERAQAIAVGAQTIHRYANGDWLDVVLIGEEWVLGKWLSAEPQWCLRAYENAR
jgi:hypothetical protein